MKNKKINEKKIKENLKETTELNLNKELLYWIEISKEYLKKLYIIDSLEDYLYMNEQLLKFKKENNTNIELMESLLIDSNYDTKEYHSLFLKLQNNFNNIKHNILMIQNKINEEDIKNINSQFDLIKNKSNALENRFEGIGGTIISVVSSVSIITAGVTAINSICPIYIPLFITSLIWMGMTFIVFVNGVFSLNDKGSKKTSHIYYFVSCLMIAIIFLNLYLVYINPELLHNNQINKSVTQVDNK